MTNEQLQRLLELVHETLAPIAMCDDLTFERCQEIVEEAYGPLDDALALVRGSPEPGACAVDPRDAVIAELTKWADDWAVYRGPAEKPVDKGWRLAAEELQSILKKSATRT